MKNPGILPFGVLAGDWRLPEGTYGRSFIKASPTGKAVKECLRQISSIHPALRILQYALMPEYFSRINRISIKGRSYAAYGNFQLLRNLFMEQVVVHRKDNLTKRDADRMRWLHTGLNGGVLVSPFISPDEKSVREEAESSGSKTILIVHEAFGERFKPSGHDFELCTDGRLLIISLGYPSGTVLSRKICLDMNSLAYTLSNTPFPFL